MAPALSYRQAEELHKSIIAYLFANNLTESATTLQKELTLEDDSFSEATREKYEALLAKKWTSVTRLQKKIMGLESRVADLQAELADITPASVLGRKFNPSLWLPSISRYSLKSHRDAINCVAFHPIFSSIASGSDDFTIKIWDWELGELEKTVKGHTRAVFDVDYGGPKGGTLLASCSSDLTIKLWDPADDYKNVRTLLGHDHSVSAVRFIPSAADTPSTSSLLVSASRDKTLRIWDVTTGYCLRTILGHVGWVRDVFPSPDGRFLFSTGDDMTARLWDISGLTPECKSVMVGHEHVNECCAIAPPASYQYLAPLVGNKTRPSSRPVADFMATGSRDKTIKLWDSCGNCVMTLRGHDNWVRALAFHPGGKYLLSVSDDRTLRCWDLSQDGKCVKVLSNQHEGSITCLRWAPGIVQEGHKSNAGSSNGDNTSNAASETAASGKVLNLDVQIRCVVAIGSIDRKLSIFND